MHHKYFDSVYLTCSFIGDTDGAVGVCGSVMPAELRSLLAAAGTNEGVRGLFPSIWTGGEGCSITGATSRPSHGVRYGKPQASFRTGQSGPRSPQAPVLIGRHALTRISVFSHARLALRLALRACG